jgi:hypothetical protein
MRSLLLALGAFAVLTPAPAPAAASMKTFNVPTGGFAIDLPRSWIDVTKAAPGVLGQLEKVPSFKAFAQAASKNAALKLIAADASAGGTVYMNVGAARIGPLTLTQIAGATAAALKKTLGAAGSVQTTSVKLSVGPAYRIHLSKKGSPNETDEYLFVKNQVEYVIVYVAPHAVWQKRAAVFASSAKTFRFLPAPDLSHVVLTGSQVAAGYKLSSFPFGTSFIGEPTLDLCAASYPSEALRTARLQVRYTHKAKGVDVSNEVVRYSGGGAQQALGEVGDVARACAAKAAVVKQGTVTETYNVRPLTDPKLPSGAIVVKLTITVRKGKQQQSQTGVAIYQAKGNTLSGVYAFVGKGTTFADAQRVAFHAAEQSAKNLGLKGAGGSSGFTA